MTSNRFYILTRQIHLPYAVLEGQEHHHLSRVARIRKKDKVWLFDEEGVNYLARVENITKEATKLLILDIRKEQETIKPLILAQALLKAKCMEMVLQKAAEWGIGNFIPVETERTVVKLDEKIEKRMQRWSKIAIESAKQSGHSQVPLISLPRKLRDLLEQNIAGRKLVLSENKGSLLRDIFFSQVSGKEKKTELEPTILLVGPEGGWSDKEEQLIMDHGYTAVHLGGFVLRAETAAISSIAIISHFWK